tara:strand:+ start:94 stop:714 length:621 start_codon:yes stop_codon:yes gene_type:complete
LNNKKKLIIFDLDGVLINSENNMMFALSKTSKKLKIKLNFNIYKKYIGLPFELIMKKMQINEKYVSQIKKNYIYFSNLKLSKLSIQKKKLYDLKELHKKYNLAIYTSKDKQRTHQILKKYKIFKAIITPDNVRKGKPNPEGLLKILKKLKVKKMNTLYVGDTKFDYLTAKNAKIKYLHVNWGFDKTLTNSKNVNVINNFLNIPKYF